MVVSQADFCLNLSVSILLVQPCPFFASVMDFESQAAAPAVAGA